MTASNKEVFFSAVDVVRVLTPVHNDTIFEAVVNIFPCFGLVTEHSINSQAGRYPNEDLVTGIHRSGHMSVVRRFFCLFVTFDLLFTILMWLIIILVSILNSLELLSLKGGEVNMCGKNPD
jgi:hypothetical protein